MYWIRDEEDYSEGEDYHEDGTRRRFKKNPRDISLDPDTSIENICREEATSIENISTERGHEIEVKELQRRSKLVLSMIIYKA